MRKYAIQRDGGERSGWTVWKVPVRATIRSVEHPEERDRSASVSIRVAPACRKLVATVADIRGDDDDVRFATSLREAFSLAHAAGTIGARVTHADLLHMIVATAAQVLRPARARCC